MLRLQNKILLDQMNKNDKEVLINSIIQDDFPNFLKTCNHFKLDNSFFDYELLKAALCKNRTIACFLIKKGFRVRNPNKANLEETPLHLAINIRLDVSYLLTMLHRGASIYDKNLKEETPLHAAFKANKHNIVDTVLDYISNCNLTFNPDNKDDVLHFHIACIRNHINSIKIYLEFGFDVNRFLSVDKAELSGLNPLHYAISNGYCDLFKILLNHGGDLSVKNRVGLTPLHIFYYKYYKFDYNNFDYHSFILFKCRNEMIQTFNYGNDTKFINSVDFHGVSHFHIYCLTNYPNYVQALIDNGADVNSSISFNCSDNPGFTPLHFATKYAHTKVIALLLKNGADCNRSDKKGITPLSFVYENCGTHETVKIIKMLLHYKTCPSAVDRKGNTLIHTLFYKVFDYANREVKDIFDMSVSEIPLEFNVTNNEGISLFHIACARNDINQVNNFLNSGATIDSYVVSGKFSGYTALHFAVLFNQKDVVEVLLKRNAQVNVKTSKSHITPLHLACKYIWVKYCQLANSADNLINSNWISDRSNQLYIIKLLLLHGADVNAKDSSKLTPLLQACMVNKDKFAISDWPDSFKDNLIKEINIRMMEIIKLLISNKANVNAYTNEKLSVFHVIVKNGFLKNPDDLLEFLISSGGDINAIDGDGLTPLHLAVIYENIELMQSLLKHRANTDKQLDPNLTRFTRTATSEICDIFLNNCNDINIRNKNGRTVLHDAIKDNESMLTKKLLHYGADINMENSFGNSTICYLLKNGEPKRVSVSSIIFIHVQKLLALGVYVSEKVKKVCSRLKQRIKLQTYRNLSNVLDECVEELARMKLEMLDNCTSLYDILLKDPHQLSRHIKNVNLIKIVCLQNTDEQFPLYSYLLKLQFKKGLLRSDVLKSATASLIYVTGLKAPDSCYDSIFKYLTNEEVVNLKAAANVIDGSKSELSGNNSSKTELLTLFYSISTGKKIDDEMFSQIFA